MSEFTSAWIRTELSRQVRFIARLAGVPLPAALPQGQDASAGPCIFGPCGQQLAAQRAPGPRWLRHFPLQLFADGISHPGTAV